MKVKKLVLLLVNTLTLLGTLYVNYFFGSGAGNQPSVGEISSLYPTLITPAGYAFSIWGLIYLLLIAFLVFQWFEYLRGEEGGSLLKSGIWFSMANLLNGLWIVVWTNELLGFSVLVIFLLLFSLIQLVLRLDLEIWDAPKKVIFFIWWPICIYLGWVVLASVVNASVLLKYVGIVEGIGDERIWTMFIIAVAVLIYLWLIVSRNLREAALVGVWGLGAIAYRHWETDNSLALAALTGAAVLLIASGLHAYKNRQTLPFQNQ